MIMKWGCVGHINMNNTASQSGAINFTLVIFHRAMNIFLAFNLAQLRRMSLEEKKREKRAFGFE